MTSKARTVDHLGLDVSVRYAKDKELEESHLLEGAKMISSRAEVSVTSPYFSSEFEELFGLKSTHRSFAQFFAPKDYASHARPLFTYQLSPSLGSLEKQQAEIEKIEAYHRDEEKKKKKKKTTDEEEKEEKEKSILLHLLKSLMNLEKDLIFIKSKRSQYHKG